MWTGGTEVIFNGACIIRVEQHLPVLMHLLTLIPMVPGAVLVFLPISLPPPVKTLCPWAIASAVPTPPPGGTSKSPALTRLSSRDIWDSTNDLRVMNKG